MRSRKKTEKGMIGMSAFTVAWYIAFCYLPMFGIIIAFKRYHIVPGKSFIYDLLNIWSSFIRTGLSGIFWPMV